MGRCRLRLEPLSSNPKARRRAYETRKKGLEKKAIQLSTLCGVDVCFIAYPPPLENEEIRPFVWSNDPARVENLIESHKLSRVGGECSKSRTCDLAWFYEDRTKKVEEEMDKVKKDIRQVKYPTNWDEQYYGSFSLEELKMFARVLTAKVESTKETIKLLKESRFLMNPQMDQSPDSILSTRLDEKHSMEAQSDNYLENERRMMMNMINNNIGINPYTAPLMRYDGESSFLMNPQMDQNPDSSLGTRLDEQHSMEAQSNHYLENERRMMMNMIINNIGSNPYTAPLMSYDESSFLMNPQMDQNSYFSLGTGLDEQHLIDAQSNNYLENQRRMMMINMINNGSNPYTAPLMSYDGMQNASDYSVAGVHRQHQVMNYFPQMLSGFHPNMGF